MDEFAPALYLPKVQEHVLWSELARRHKVLFGLILQAFRTRQPIRYSHIASQTFKKDGVLVEPDPGNIRRTKSELNGRLHGLLDIVVMADRSMDQYVINGQIPYCWIRPGDKSSRLRR